MSEFASPLVPVLSTFVERYKPDHAGLLLEVKQGILAAPPPALEEILLIISCDGPAHRDPIIAGSYALDLRRLHVQTVFLLWCFLRDRQKNPSISADDILRYYKL